MALYIKDKIVIDHCKTNDGIRLIMNWMATQGDPPQFERHEHCIILTVKCYESPNSLNRMSSASSNIVTIPLNEKDGDSICVNPFTVRKRRRKLSSIIDMGGYGYFEKRKRNFDINIFNDDDYELYDQNLTSNLRDFILTIPAILRDKKISTILD